MKAVKTTWVWTQQNKVAQVQVTVATVLDQFMNLNALRLKIIKDGKFRIMGFSLVLKI